MKLRKILVCLMITALSMSMFSCDEDKVLTDTDDKIVNPNADTDGEEASDKNETDITSAADKVTEPVTSATDMPAKATVPEFKTDLSAYEKYMNPGNTTEYLTVVSREHTLPSTHEPTDRVDLVDTRKDGRNTQQMREYAAKSMEAMFIEMRAAGYTDVSITSAYRSYVYQESIFNMYLQQNNNDYDYVATFSNPPGSSEHQTGLCADLHNLSSADVSFANKPAFAWLRDNCYKFGFILRYPEDKVDVTGISYEPWHYRYVGRYHAERIYNEGLCLEEYVSTYYPELLS